MLSKQIGSKESELDYKLYHADIDLDYDSYFCIEDIQLNSNFTDNYDFAMLSENILSTEEQKKDRREISASFNIVQKDTHKYLKNKVNYIINKLKSTYQKQTIIFEDLVELMYEPDLDIAKIFISSSIVLIKNNYDKLYQFLGIFFFCSWLEFTLKQALNNKYGNTIFYLDIIVKLINYKKYTSTLNQINSEGLKSVHVPNHKIAITPRIYFFQ